MKQLLDLFIAFFRIGILTFGGGYAMLPMLQAEVVQKHHWATEEELMDYFAVGQCTPGVIAVNTATFVGYYQKGVLGAITATAGVITPSFFIIIIIAAFIQNFAHLPVVQHAFAGIRVAVAVLIINAITKLWRNSIKDKIGVAIFLIALCVAILLPISPVYIVITALTTGIIVKKARRLI